MPEHPLIIVQARMGSSRLPGKVLKPLCGQPMLLWQLDRLAQVQSQHAQIRTVVAVAHGEENRPIMDLCQRHGYECVMPRCEDKDVLGRYASTAEIYKADPIIRVTADCPLIDPMVVATLCAVYAACGNKGYVGLAEQWPEGQDCEVFSLAAVREAHAHATAPSDREHVTPYIKRSVNPVDAKLIACPFDYSHIQYSVDTAEDFEVAEALLAACVRRHSHAFGWREIAERIRNAPWIERMLAEREAQRPRNHAYHDQVWRESGGTTVHLG